MNRWAYVRLSRIIRVSLAVLALAGAMLSSGSLPLRAKSNIQFETTLGHFAPFSDSLPRSKVNVWIDGQPAASGLAYLQQAESLTLDEGTHEIVVTPFEWSGGTITRTFELHVGETPALPAKGAVLAIIGGTSGIPLGVLAHVVERTPPAQGARVRLTNLALFAPGGDSEYTLCNVDGSTFSNMEMVRFGKSSQYADIPEGTYPVYLAGSYSECGDHLTPELLLIFEDKSVADLYAVGSNASRAFPDTLTVVSTSAIVLRPVAYIPRIKG